jgi:serine/threonine protein kinase
MLERECAGDPELRRRVEALLKAHDDPGSFLEKPIVRQTPVEGASAPENGGLGKNQTVAEPTRIEMTGSYIGPFKLLQKLGEGGMGRVYMAEQEHPVRRRVALKVVKAGMDSAQVSARFEQERQALALMDHPNIARVLDAGTADTGQPYFVMELVKGIPITKFCDQERLSPRERLELFIPVCQAVQHAHQKGIIHRDLKPSNVLIALYDGKPVPKVIDFGVAKAMAQKLTERTMFTEVGQIVGTLEYMSPEQAELNNLDIDTRADVYSLGAILYELLAGSPPFSRQVLQNAAFTDMLRMIREVEPPKPSTKLSSSNELPAIAARRKLEPVRLTRLITGELDWITLKALEKERGRRYETANGLAMDIRRYLDDEPVLAGPPRVSYRLRKFVRRNKGPVLAGAAILLCLIGGIAGTTWGMIEAVSAKKAEAERAEEALAASQREADLADKERQANSQAQERLGQLQKGNEILTSIFADLDPQAEDKEGKPLRAILGERVADAAKQIEGASLGDALTVASIQNRLGRSLLGLGLADQAVSLLEKARETRCKLLGADQPDTLTTMYNLARSYGAAGRLDLAVKLQEETLKLRKEKLGPDHIDTLTSMAGLAGALWSNGHRDQALPVFEEAYNLRKAKLGPDHPDTLDSMGDLASGYAGVLDYQRALPLYKETLSLMTAKLGPDHDLTLTTMHNLAWDYAQLGQFDRALPLYAENLKLRKAKLGPDHPKTLWCMGNLADCYFEAHQFDKALPLLEENFKQIKAKLGAEHPDTIYRMIRLAAAYHLVGKLELAVPLEEEALRLARGKYSDDHMRIVSYSILLGKSYQAQGKLDQALPLFLNAAAGLKRAQFPTEDSLAVPGLCRGLEELGKVEEAEELSRQWLAAIKAHGGADSMNYANALATLGSDLLQQKKWSAAEPVLRECLGIREKNQPKAWKTFNAKSMFGEALLAKEAC